MKQKKEFDIFIEKIKEFTKRVCEDAVEDLKDNENLLKEQMVALSYNALLSNFTGHIVNKKSAIIYTLKHNSVIVSIYDFIENTEEYIDRYKNLIIKSKEDNKKQYDSNINKKTLCFDLSLGYDFITTKGSILQAHSKNMHYLKLLSDLDYSSTRITGIADSFDKLYDLCTGYDSLTQADFNGSKEEYIKFFSSYYNLIERIIGINYENYDIYQLNKLKHFFNIFGSNLTSKQIEYPFEKIIENKSMENEDDLPLLRSASKIVSFILGKDCIRSKALKELIAKCDKDVIAFEKVELIEFEKIIFNNDYFYNYNFKSINYEYAKPLEKQQFESFSNLLMYILTSKSSQEYFGIVKTSSVVLPSDKTCFFLEVNANYSEEKLHAGIAMACKFIERETMNNPIDDNEFNVYMNDFFISKFQPYLLEMEISEKLDSVKREEFSNINNTHVNNFLKL